MCHFLLTALAVAIDLGLQGFEMWLEADQSSKKKFGNYIAACVGHVY